VAKGDLQLERIEGAYRLGYGQFLHVATAITGDVELAADAVQDGFVRAITRRNTYRGAGEVEGWLWRIVVNAARDVSARRRDVSVDGVPEQEEPRPAVPEINDVRAAVASLPERQRLCLFLRYFADLDYQTIGHVLEISPGTVGATLHSAHSALRTQLEEVRSV